MQVISLGGSDGVGRRFTTSHSDWFILLASDIVSL